jgi:hypothetical protein
MSNEPKLQGFVALYAMISRMRVLSLPRTVACTEKIMKATVNTYFARSRLQASPPKGDHLDHL